MYTTTRRRKRCLLATSDYIIIAGDFNGHVGEKADGNKYHEEKGFGQHNDGGKRIVNFANIHDLAVVNTSFIKRLFYLPFAGEVVLIRRQHFTIIINWKTSLRDHFVSHR